MQNSEFEKKMQQKMEELKLSPADNVWDKIEAGLPPEKKPRRWIIFILLFAGLTTGALILWNHFYTTKSQAEEDLSIAQKTVLQNTISKNPVSSEAGIFADTVSLKIEKPDEALIGGGKWIKNLTKPASVKVKISNGATAYSDIPENENTATDKEQVLKTNAIVKAKIKAAVPVSDIDEDFVADTLRRSETGKIKTVITNEVAIAETQDLITADTKSKKDSVVIKTIDTTDIPVKEKSVKKKENSNWQYGVGIASGISTVKNNLFNSSPVFASSAGSFSSGSPNPGGVNNIPNNPSAGIAFNLSFYVQKNINSRWKFNTGLNYLYQSNAIRTGNRVDSTASFYFTTKSLKVNSFYRSGDSIGYKNKFHLLEIPVLFQYRISKKYPAYIEAGPSVAYLLNSNAMVYKANQGLYITDNAIFNRLLLSMSIGAGFNLAEKSRFPFTIGYQFKYSMSSVIKDPFGKQHIMNSLLYLRVPLKK